MNTTTPIRFALVCALAISFSNLTGQTTSAKPTSEKTFASVNTSKTTTNKTTTNYTTVKSVKTVSKPATSVSKPATTKTVQNKPVVKNTLNSNLTAPTITRTKPPVSQTKSDTAVSETAVNLIREKQYVAGYKPAYVPKVVDVTDQTIRLGGGKKEELMFGFAAGDKIIFNFRELDGKDVKEIEVIEYPTMSRFSEYKTSGIKNKEILVNQQAVFIFRMKNTSIAKRVCKLKIQRIPASQASENFNSSVKWITKQDTVWTSYTNDVIIGYDTSYVARKRKVLVRSEIEEQILSDEILKINAQQKSDNRSSIALSLPLNSASPYRTSRVLSWAYWIGVGEEGRRAWQQNLQNTRSSNLDYYTPVGAYANGRLPMLTLQKSGQSINYFIADQANRDLFMQKQPFKHQYNGNGYGDYKKFTRASDCQGTVFLCFENLNIIGTAYVNVKVAALVERAYYEDQMFDEEVITPVTERQIKQQPSIRNTSLPVTGL